MDEPQKVDWTQAEPPSCENCRHFIRGDHRTPEAQVRFAKCAVVHLFDSTDPLWISMAREEHRTNSYCGPTGKLYSRRPKEAGTYDFDNDPPEPMSWAA